MKYKSGNITFKSLCGDKVKFDIKIKNNVIKKIDCYTEYCENSLICGHVLSELAVGKNINDALNISPDNVMKIFKIVSGKQSINGIYCSILAVNTLHSRIAEYIYGQTRVGI